MISLLGEHYCKLDSKGRVILPAALKKQIPTKDEGIFVINRGFEKCLVLYTKSEWSKKTKEINKLNAYVAKNRKFIRYFYRGATELKLDASNRLLIPKMLKGYAFIEKEIVLFAHSNKIEIWDVASYESLIDDEPKDFEDLAENVMGNINIDDDDE